MRTVKRLTLIKRGGAKKFNPATQKVEATGGTTKVVAGFKSTTSNQNTALSGLSADVEVARFIILGTLDFVPDEIECDGVAYKVIPSQFKKSNKTSLLASRKLF